MDIHPAIPQWTAALFGALVMASLCGYGFLFRFVFRSGKVRVADFGLPDLMAGTVFFTWLLGTLWHSFSAPARIVTKLELIEGGTLYLVIILALCGFLKLRKISLTEIFGLTRVAIWKLPLYAIGLLLAIFPLLGAAGAITQKMLGPDAHPQEIVKFFQQAVQQGDSRSVLITVIIGAVIAPMAEELMFRGFLYGLCKRYVGVIAGVVINSIFFSAMHGNMAALPALCILAIALTLAYELTGCLLVPIAMHALFNLTMFVVMLNAPA